MLPALVADQATAKDSADGLSFDGYDGGGIGGATAGGFVAAALCSRRFTVNSSFCTREKRRSASLRVSGVISTQSSQWKRVAGLPFNGYSNCLPQARQVRMRVTGWGLDIPALALAGFVLADGARIAAVHQEAAVAAAGLADGGDADGGLVGDGAFVLANAAADA